MATKSHNNFPLQALVSVALALAIGSLPLAALLTLGTSLESIK